LNYLKHSLRIFLLLGLAACQSLPPEPEPAPEAVIEEAPGAVETAAVVDPNIARYESAISDLKNKKFETAIQQLETLSQTAPELEFVFTNLGLAQFKLENYDKAKQAFEQAIAQNNQDAVAFNHLGIIHRLRGQFDEASQAYQSAIKINSKYAQAHLNLGILYDIYLQDLKLALAQYQTYQTLTDNEDKTVEKWIVDIERRIKAGQS